MADVLEVPVGTGCASFDGRVLEIFTGSQSGSRRYHVRLLTRCWIDGSVLNAEFQQREQGFWPFSEDRRAQVEGLVQAVEAARQA